MRRFDTAVAVAVTAALAAQAISPAGAGAVPWAAINKIEAVDYRPPVDAPVIDVFRPPATPYGPGNRGIDYGTHAGQAVVAAAGGRVVFAGRVGAGLHAVVLHDDGIRTSYSFLSALTVRRGDVVAAGERVGTAAATGLHVGARAGSTYLDPLLLFGPRPRQGPRAGGRVHLVADPEEGRPLSEVHERARLVESLRTATRMTPRRPSGALSGVPGPSGALSGVPGPSGALSGVPGPSGPLSGTTDHGAAPGAWDVARWLGQRGREAVERRARLILVLVHDAVSLGVPWSVELALGALAWHEGQQRCTPAGVVHRQTGNERRIAMLVGGLGSSTGRAAVLEVDTQGLGYSPSDVHQFTYRADRSPYGPGDTVGDIGVAGGFLARQLRSLASAHPAVAIDVIAHSQGGLVARVAITRHRLPGVATVVTLATPHQGADLATAGAALDGSASGHGVLGVVGALRPGGIDPNGKSVRQMAETSAFLRHLARSRWPPVITVVSVAARGDLVVPNTQSYLPDAANVVVTPGGSPGLHDHARLPGSAEATREIALAVAGWPPTCRSLLDHLFDLTTGRQAERAADAAGAALAVAGFWVDSRVKGALLARLR